MSHPATAPITVIKFRLDGQERTAKGRSAWALAELVAAGQDGCTPILRPAPRWSDYVFRLKKLGLNIETIHERHGGAYKGFHGRYRLDSDIDIIETKTADDAGAVRS
jgi:hypothetical protein